MTKAELESARLAREDACDWLLRLRSENLGESDTRAFRQWCSDHPDAAHLLQDTWTALGTAAAEIRQEERAGQHDSAARSHGRISRTGRRAFIGFAVAAGATWFAVRPPLGLWPSLSELASDYRTGTGEQRRVMLSARVTVEMNTQTSLELLPGQNAVRGVELLAGEAEIDAAAPAAGHAGAMRPVSVVAGRGRIGAEVARFNVRRTDTAVSVTCLSGTVTLDHPRGRLTLVADDQVSYDDLGVKSVSKTNTDNVTAWRRGLLVFNNVPLSEVVEEINRYRPGRIILRNAALGENRVQAQFPLSRLDDALNMLCRMYDGHITRLPGRIAVLT